MPNNNAPSIHTLHEYDETVSSMYARMQEGQRPPRISDPAIAYNLGHELMIRLSDNDEQYELNLEHSRAVADPGDALQMDFEQRVEGIAKAASILEFKHRKEAPIDFIDGESHYRNTTIDQGMAKRMQAVRLKREEERLGSMIDELGLDKIDPNHGRNHLQIMKPRPGEPKPKPPDVPGPRDGNNC